MVLAGARSGDANTDSRSRVAQMVSRAAANHPDPDAHDQPKQSFVYDFSSVREH
jgi:hypothetical protein